MYNKSVLIGHIVADPELKTTPKGVNVCSFRIAVDRPYKQGDERKADFINIVAWRGTGEFVSRYFSKGKVIGIEGAIQTRDYTDKDGNKRYGFEVVAEKAFFVAPKTSDDAQNGNAPTAESDDYAPIEDSDDLPF